MTQHTLQRTGGAPVSFIGEIVVCMIGDTEQGPKGHARNHSVTIYRTRAGKTWIVEIHYSTTWATERDETTVEIVRAPDEASAARKIAAKLSEYDLCGPITGYPDHPAFANKQERLLARHEADWAALVSAVLTQLGAVEEVR